MSVRISLDLLGEDRMERTIMRPARKALDLSDGLNAALDLVEDRIGQQFASQGGQSGGWEPLAASTVARKGHATILEETGVLKRAATSGAQRRVGPTEASFAVGSDAPYFVFHHSKAPRSRLPRRPLIEVDEPFKRKVMRELQRDLFGVQV
jgi:hypothetical protein